MEDRAASIEDYRQHGTIFGMACAKAAKAKMAEGQDKAAIKKFIVDGMIPVKDAQLRKIGASQAEVDAFMRAAGAATYAAFDGQDFLGILNRHERRAAAARAS